MVLLADDVEGVVCQYFLSSGFAESVVLVVVEAPKDSVCQVVVVFLFGKVSIGLVFYHVAVATDIECHDGCSARKAFHDGAGEVFGQ